VDFCADKVVRATRAQVRQLLGIHRIYETHYLWKNIEIADEALIRGNAATDKWKYLVRKRMMILELRNAVSAE
jgi:hypothetical protein